MTRPQVGAEEASVEPEAGARQERRNRQRPSSAPLHQPLLEAAGIEPAPGGAKLPAESRPYLVTARNAWESISRRVPSCPALFRAIPQAPATYVQHGGACLRTHCAPALPSEKVTFPRVTVRGPAASQSVSVQGQPSCPGSLSVPTTTAPVLCNPVPPKSALEGHIGGT